MFYEAVQDINIGEIILVEKNFTLTKKFSEDFNH